MWMPSGAHFNDCDPRSITSDKWFRRRLELSRSRRFSACHRHFDVNTTASCLGFWSCQARAGCNGYAVLLFVSALRVPAATLSPAFGPP
jgi:hypothetical protein